MKFMGMIFGRSTSAEKQKSPKKKKVSKKTVDKVPKSEGEKSFPRRRRSLKSSPLKRKHTKEMIDKWKSPGYLDRLEGTPKAKKKFLKNSQRQNSKGSFIISSKKSKSSSAQTLFRNKEIHKNSKGGNGNASSSTEDSEPNDQNAPYASSARGPIPKENNKLPLSPMTSRESGKVHSDVSIREKTMEQRAEDFDWAKRVFYSSAEKVFPGYTRISTNIARCVRPIYFCRSRSSLVLGMLILASYFFGFVWAFGFITLIGFKLPVLKKVHGGLILGCSIVFLIINYIRLTTGIQGNSSDDAQQLGVYWMMTVLVQLPIITFLLLTDFFSTTFFPLITVMDIIAAILLIAEVLVGFLHLRSLIWDELSVIKLAQDTWKSAVRKLAIPNRQSVDTEANPEGEQEEDSESEESSNNLFESGKNNLRNIPILDSDISEGFHVFPSSKQDFVRTKSSSSSGDVRRRNEITMPRGTPRVTKEQANSKLELQEIPLERSKRNATNLNGKHEFSKSTSSEFILKLNVRKDYESEGQPLRTPQELALRRKLVFEGTKLHLMKDIPTVKRRLPKEWYEGRIDLPKIPVTDTTKKTELISTRSSPVKLLHQPTRIPKPTTPTRISRKRKSEELLDKSEKMILNTRTKTDNNGKPSLKEPEDKEETSETETPSNQSLPFSNLEEEEAAYMWEVLGDYSSTEERPTHPSEARRY